MNQYNPIVRLQQLQRGDGGDSAEQAEHEQDGLPRSPHGTKGRWQDRHHLTGTWGTKTRTELGARQLVSFATVTTQQRDGASVTRKI